jgi:TetR/AcrR family transcriptional repressor of nem operon
MQERGRRTRARLVAEMRRAIQHKGVSRASIGDVLQAAGAKKGSLYFHFQDKDELALAALGEAGEEFHDFVGRALARGDSPEAQLASFFREVLALHRDQGFTGGCVFGNTSLEMADADPRYAGLMQEVFDGWANQLTGVIARAQEAGSLRGDVPAAELAYQVLAAVEGGVMLARLRKSEGPLRDSLQTLWTLMGAGGEWAGPDLGAVSGESS